MGANFEGAIITNGDLGNVDLSFANFHHARFHYDKPKTKGFQHSSLRRANFAGADLEGVSFNQSDLRCARFASASYLNVSELKREAIVKGTGTWTLAIFDDAMESRLHDGATVKHRSKIDLFDLKDTLTEVPSFPAEQPSLRAVDDSPVLYCYGLMIDHIKPADKVRWLNTLKDRFVRFKRSRKSQRMGVDFRYAHLEDHDLSASQLQGANLQDAYLNNTNLDGSDLKGVNFEGVKKLSCHQLATAQNWPLAVFTTATKDSSQGLFVPVNPAANQQALAQLRNNCPELR